MIKTTRRSPTKEEQEKIQNTLETQKQTKVTMFKVWSRQGLLNELHNKIPKQQQAGLLKIIENDSEGVWSAVVKRNWENRIDKIKTIDVLNEDRKDYFELKGQPNFMDDTDIETIEDVFLKKVKELEKIPEKFLKYLEEIKKITLTLAHKFVGYDWRKRPSGMIYNIEKTKIETWSTFDKVDRELEKIKKEAKEVK